MTHSDVGFTFPSQGLYAITQPEQRTLQQVLSDVEAVLQGGARVLQYRDKTPQDAVALGRQLVTLCHRYQVPLLVNDSIALAREIGADGVHLGRDDGEVEVARQQLGRSAIVGVSCYNDIERALAAQAAGADYVAFGRFFASGSKPLAAPAAIATLQQARLCIQVPIVAIGGILPDNGRPLLDAGANLLAVIGGLYQDGQPRQAAEAYQALFN